jgi:hypothetical protein
MHLSHRLRQPRHVVSTVFPAMTVLLCLWLAQPASVSASSAIFGGDPFYTGGTTTMNALRASGYTTVVLWTIHVDATTGNLIFNDQLLASNGVYVGTSTWPAQLKTLKSAPTSVNRIEVSVGSYGVNDFQSVQTLMSTHGTNTTSLLYSNFYALKVATGADAIDFDDETLYSVPTTVEFGQMLSSMGYQVTFCPYTDSSFWQSAYDQLGSGIVDAVYLQCYSGGAGNDPGTWDGYFNGLKVQPGLWCNNGDDCASGSSASEVAAQMTAWRAADGIPGGFMWEYDNMLSCTNGGTPANYAQAINRAVDPLAIMPLTGFTGATAYNLRSLPVRTPFTLSNAAAASLNWSVINTSSWVTVSASSGSLAVGATTSVTASLNQAVATNLALGSYAATVIFSNQTTAVGLVRNFALDTAVANWPIALTGFNATVLASNNATVAAPGATGFDIPNDYCFYQQGLGGSSQGLPWTGFFLSQCDSNTAFQLGPYAAADALLLGDTYVAAGTLNLASPDAFNSLSVLAASANGGGQGTLVLNFTDGTSSPALPYNCQDWFYTVTNVAIQGFGRLQLSGWSIENNGSSNPNLYQTTLNLAALGLARPLASITFRNPAGGGAGESTAIFAVSGMSTSIPLLPPGGLVAIPGTNATAQLSWQPSLGATNYQVKQSTVSGSGYVAVGGGPSTTYAATGLANGTIYYYVVSAGGVANESSNTSPVSVVPGSYVGWAMGVNPVAYWPLNETSGIVAYDLVLGSNGTYTGMVTLTAGGDIAAGFPNPHRSAYYSGSGYTLIPNLIGSTNFSIMFWLRTSATGGSPNWYNGEGLVDADVSGTTNDFGVALVGAKIGFGVGNPDTTLTSARSVNDFAWHHVVTTRNAGSGLMTIYIDGKEDSSRTGPAGGRASSPVLHIGNIASGGGFYTGYISDVAVYPEVLTTNQIATLYSAATGLFYNITLTNQFSGGNLVLSWPGNGKLLQSTNLAGPWTTNVSASPVTVTPAAPQQFYRVLTQ